MGSGKPPNRAKDNAERLALKLKSVRKTYNKINKSSQKGKAVDTAAKNLYDRAQKNYDEVKKVHNRLKRDGEDFSAAGFQATRNLAIAKKELAKRKVIWERAAPRYMAKQTRMNELKEKMKEIQQQQTQAEEAVKAARKANKH